MFIIIFLFFMIDSLIIVDFDWKTGILEIENKNLESSNILTTSHRVVCFTELIAKMW